MMSPRAKCGWLGRFRATGFGPTDAHRPPDPTAVIIGRSMVMKGSMCLRGLNVRRPSIYAVESPCRYAASAWAYSWATIENSRTGAQSRNSKEIARARVGDGKRYVYA